MMHCGENKRIIKTSRKNSSSKYGTIRRGGGGGGSGDYV